jgi:quinol monooxygenase YgiN
MGSAASGLSAAVQVATDAELRDCVKGMDEASRRKIAAALKDSDQACTGMVLVEVAIVEGKLEEAFELFTTHDMGLKYTSSQPGFLNMAVALDTEKNSVILMEKWVKKEDWIAYGATRQVENDANKAWNEAFGPLVNGAPRMIPMDIAKNYTGTTELAADASYGVALVEVPIVKGKLNDAYELFTTHDMGLKYTSSQPGFLNMAVGLDADSNSVILFEKWVKKEDWIAYGATRQVENAANTAWTEAFGPLLNGPPRMGAMDCRKNYTGAA